MAGKDSSEEKKHPPTMRRLNELRREGQVPRSQDLPPALSLVLAILALLVTGSALFQRMGATMASDIAVSSEAFATRVSSMIVLVSDAALIVLAPVFVAAMLGLLLASVVDAGGLPISVKSVTPDLTHLNPVEGMKRIFGLPSLINLVKGVIKIVLIGVAIWFVVRLRLNDMLWAPTCGLGCLQLVTIYLVLPLIVLGAIILLVMALIDLKLARWTFKRENRMSETELKRDRREDMGDPLFKGARRQIREEIMAGPRSRRDRECQCHCGITRACGGIALCARRNAGPRGGGQGQWSHSPGLAVGGIKAGSADGRRWGGDRRTHQTRVCWQFHPRLAVQPGRPGTAERRGHRRSGRLSQLVGWRVKIGIWPVSAPYENVPFGVSAGVRWV
jgi:type III secretion protein U